MLVLTYFTAQPARKHYNFPFFKKWHGYKLIIKTLATHLQVRSK